MNQPADRLRLMACLTALPAALGTALLVGWVLQPRSLDRPISPQELLGWGWRWGLLLTVALGAAASLGPRRPAEAHRVLRAVAAAVALQLGLTALAALLALLAQKLGWVGLDWRVSSRRGLLLRMVGESGLQAFGLPVAAAAGLMLWRSRRSAV